MLKSICLVAAAFITSVVGHPTSDSLDADIAPANETRLYPSIPYILPADYTPEKQ